MRTHYKSRCLFWAQVNLALAATFLSLLMVIMGHPINALLLFTFIALCLNRPRAQLNTVTLSAPEILSEVLNSFALDIPRFDWFTTDFSTDTAVLGDKVTAHLSHVPAIGTYDRNNGGFYNAAQDVTTLIEDVPVILSQLPVVCVKVGWLTQLSSKAGTLQGSHAKYCLRSAQANLQFHPRQRQRQLLQPR